MGIVPICRLGWVGAQEIFKSKAGMNCSYTENNIKLSHGFIVIAMEDASYEVNGKASTVTIMGNQSSGFTYKVEWYDALFFREIECAGPDYNSKMTSLVINIAKAADNS
jgi:hypothetical protein